MLKIFTKLPGDEKGFTLMELMIVVMIIGFLAAIALPAFSSATDKARMSRAKAELRTLESGLAMYYGEKGVYPAKLEALKDGYVQAVPAQDPWGEAYQYDSTTGEVYSIGSGQKIHSSTE